MTAPVTRDDLLLHLHRGGTAAHLWAKLPDARKQSFWFPAGTIPAIPIAWRDADIYFGLHPTGALGDVDTRSTNKTVTAINCLYAEFDAKDPAFGGDKQAILSHILQLWDKGNGLPYPTVIVDSGGGVHAYHLLESTVMIDDSNRERLRAIQAGWVKLWGGDKGASDLARVLRVPSTLNHKYKPARPVTIVEGDARRLYQLEDLTAFLPPESTPVATAGPSRAGPPPSVRVSPAPTLADTDLIAAIRASRQGVEFDRLWAGDTSLQAGDHSAADSALCRILAYWTNRDPGQIDQLFRQSGLYRPKWDRDDYRQRTIDGAIAHTPNVYAPSHRDQAAIDAANAAIGLGTAAQGPSRGAGAQSARRKEPTIVDYVNAAGALGYTFRRNLLDDALEANGEPVDDYIAADLRARMREMGFTKSSVMEDAIQAHAKGRAYHPVKDYLSSLTWDGTDSIAALAQHFQDAHQAIVYVDGSIRTVFHAWLRRWLIGAIAKVFVTNGAIHGQNPMLVLDGAQDLGKSTFVAWLCSPLPKLFIEAPIQPDDKEADRYLASRWIWEVSELGATTRRQDIEALKGFLTKQEVNFRKPYDHHPVKKPALASFIGTINDQDGFLVDPTGNRRFLSVKLTAIDKTYQAGINIDQVWAQAFALYLGGEPWRLLPVETVMRDAVNDGFTIEDSYSGWIAKYFFIDSTQTTWEMRSSEITEVLQKQGVTGGTKTIQMGVSASLKKLGIERVRTNSGMVWRGLKEKP